MRWYRVLILLIVSAIVFGLGLWWFLATKGTRRYAREVYKLELYSRRQQLQIEITTQTKIIRDQQRDARRIKPVYKSETE